MKIFKRNLGFTVVELIFVMSLLGAVTLGSGAYISNAFKDSNNLSSKAEVQTSVTALMNKLETTIKTANIPVFENLTEGETIINESFKINQLKNGNIESVKFEYANNQVLVNGTTYAHIEKIEITPYKNGAEITIVGEENKYSLTSTYYTRNTVSASCNHVWDNEEIISESTCETAGIVKYTCIKCGVTKTEETSSGVHFFSWAIDADTHCESCSLCGYDRVPEENHKFVDDECTVCGYVKEDNGGSNGGNSHTHSWDDGVITKESTCTEKGEIKYTCSCGEIKTEELALKAHVSSGWKNDSTNHWKVCTSCGTYTVAKEVHTFVNNKCTVCEYIKSSGNTHTHSWDDGVITKESTCTEKGEIKYTCSCGETKTEELPLKDHTFSWAIDANTHCESCIVCGYDKTAEAAHIYEWSIDGTTHCQSCIVCGYDKTAEAAHIYEWSIDGTTHCQSCIVCGYDKTAEAAHIYEWSIDGTTHCQSCIVCGYDKTAEAAHIYEWSIDGTTHCQSCIVCGYDKTAEAAHIYEWSIDGTTHCQSCIVCGYDKTAEAAHTYSNGECTTCGYQKQ